MEDEEIKDSMEMVNSFLESMKNQRNKEIFEYCSGINGKPKKTEIEIAKMYGLSGQSISNIKRKVLRELQKYF